MPASFTRKGKTLEEVYVFPILNLLVSIKKKKKRKDYFAPSLRSDVEFILNTSDTTAMSN